MGIFSNYLWCRVKKGIYKNNDLYITINNKIEDCRFICNNKKLENVESCSINMNRNKDTSVHLVLNKENNKKNNYI